MDRNKKSPNPLFQQVRRSTRETTTTTKIVDLAGCYWNRPDLLKQLHRLTQAAAQALVSGRSSNNTAPRQGWSVADRYSPEELAAMIDLYQGGKTAAEVAHACGVSVSTVRRLIRKRGARRKDERR
jgi:DNA-directed RNA polymerase specialized sigma24 family protein